MYTVAIAEEATKTCDFLFAFKKDKIKIIGIGKKKMFVLVGTLHPELGFTTT
jgi:hypothetical protein